MENTKEEFITVNHLLYKYEYLTKSAVHVFSYKNKGASFIKKEGSRILINVAYLEELSKDYRRMWLAGHEYYYYLSDTLGISDSNIAKALGEAYDVSYMSWVDFVRVGLWHRVDTRSIIDLEYGYKLPQFCEWCEFAIPELNKRMKNGKKYKLQTNEKLRQSA